MIGPFLQQLAIASIMVGLTVIVHFAGLSVLLAMTIVHRMNSLEQMIGRTSLSDSQRNGRARPRPDDDISGPRSWSQPA